MTSIRLYITFNQPFRVAAGHCAEDANDVIDRENPLPATSLKGVLRDAARLLLPGTGQGDDYQDQDLVNEVFGRPGRHEASWHFSDTVFESDLGANRYAIRARVSIDERRRARPGALYVGEELEVAQATAEITQISMLDSEQQLKHLALLHLAARLVDGLGSDRRRGLGWVSISTGATNIEEMVDMVLGSRA